MRVVAIIQARMTSTRLPGKVLKTVLNKTLLEYQIERVVRCKMIDEIVVATTTNLSDNPIVKICERLGVSNYRGSEFDVLARYYETARHFNADVVVRLTSDCPVIDPLIIDQVIRLYLEKQASIDYLSNTLERTYPRGMDVEVFSMKSLTEAFRSASKTYEKEHVTPYIYLHQDKFNIEQILNEFDYSQTRLTVDTKEDFKLLSLIIEKLYPDKDTFNLSDILEFLLENPDLNLINKNVKQKKLGE